MQVDVEIVPGIKSRPKYPPISLKPNSQSQVFIAQGQSFDTLQALYDDCDSADKRKILVLKDGVSKEDSAISLTELSATLSALPLSVSFYLAGTEAFMWDVAKIIQEAGFLFEQIAMQPPVSSERRLFCTHCYAITEPVTHSPVVCRGCGRHLLVRDHFSKIHRAYVGVQIDAEDPADLPAVAEELI